MNHPDRSGPDGQDCPGGFRFSVSLILIRDTTIINLFFNTPEILIIGG